MFACPMNLCLIAAFTAVYLTFKERRPQWESAFLASCAGASASRTR